MRKVGTISSAVGLIFYGIWMIVRQNDKVLASEVFKWWPILFIVIGIEILILLGVRSTEKRVGFNPLIIIIVILFLFTNITMGVKYQVNKFVKNNNVSLGISDLKNMIDNFDVNYNKVEVEKEIAFSGSKLNIQTNNGSINIKKSENRNIKIAGKVSVSNENKNININPQVIGDQCTLDFDDGRIKSINIDIYVPNNIQLKIDSDNIKLDSNDNTLKADYVINADNGAVKINGDAEKIITKIDNGIVSVKNKLSKDVDIELDNGTVNLKTEDKNAEIKADIDAGVCSVNKTRIVNSGISKIYGNGTSKIKITASHGTVDVSSQE